MAATQTMGKADVMDAAEFDATVARIEALAKVMDSAFTIPGTNTRLGLDAVLGLVPVAGDLVSQAIASYIIWEAKRLGVPKLTLARMVTNSLIDTAIGAVPLVGDVFDVAYRANLKNVALLRRHLETAPRSGRAINLEAGRDFRRVARPDKFKRSA